MYQLSLPLNLEFEIPVDDPVRLLRYVIEGMDLTALYHTYSRIEKKQASPRQLLEILVYANMNQIYTSRRIEESCRRDLNFMYLLEGKPAPDHATIARFRSLHLATCMPEIFAQLDAALQHLGVLSLENLFVDGTKIEAAANKYTFVWKRAVSKHQQKLLAQIPVGVNSIEQQLGISFHLPPTLHLYHLRKIRNKLRHLQQERYLSFVHGKGKRKSPLQRAIETVDSYLYRLKGYAYELHRCGWRNSFSKTDKDATFMRMKEDAMKNGQLKPAYNVQYGVDAEFIVWVTAGPQPTDTPTLLPFLADMEHHTGWRYPRVIADAGYESEENYVGLKQRGQTAYIKPANYEQQKTRSYRQDIGRKENMQYDAPSDSFTCAAGRTLSASTIRHRTSASGYVAEVTQYTCQDCRGCPHKPACIHGNRWRIPEEDRVKRIEMSKRFQQERREDQKRISTPLGKQLRMNRSIQSEGAFAMVKEDLSFRRFLSRGQQHILVESMVVAMAANIWKLHHKIQQGRQDVHLFPLSVVA